MSSSGLIFFFFPRHGCPVQIAASQLTAVAALVSTAGCFSFPLSLCPCSLPSLVWIASAQSVTVCLWFTICLSLAACPSASLCADYRGCDRHTHKRTHAHTIVHAHPHTHAKRERERGDALRSPHEKRAHFLFFAPFLIHTSLPPPPTHTHTRTYIHTDTRGHIERERERGEDKIYGKSRLLHRRTAPPANPQRQLRHCFKPNSQF